MRRKSDGFNCFVSGGATMMMLTLDTVNKPKSLAFTFMGGGMFGVVMEHLMDGVMH